VETLVDCCAGLDVHKDSYRLLAWCDVVDREGVAACLPVQQALMQVAAAGALVGVRLGHERRQVAVAAGDLL
jgi:hypothetical protein